MADKIVVMRGGHVEQIGSPLDLYDTPANVFVAGFIGSPSMNLLSGRLDGAGIFTSQKGAKIKLAEPVGIDRGREVVMGIRPEDISIAEDGIEARVRIVEPTGAELYVILDVAGEQMTAVIHGRPDIREAEMVRIAIPQDKLHFFDEKSGDRIQGIP